MIVTGILGHLNISDGFRKTHTGHIKKLLILTGDVRRRYAKISILPPFLSAQSLTHYVQPVSIVLEHL